MLAKEQITIVTQPDAEISEVKIFPQQFNPAINAIIQKNGNAKWKSDDFSWTIPFTIDAINIVDELVDRHNLNIAFETYDELLFQTAEKRQKINASKAVDTNLDIPRPDGLEYRGYQKAGVEYGINHKDIIIGDEPGLGKTIQGIGISNAIPWIQWVLIIAPSSLKSNWKGEWEKWCVKKLSVGIVKNGDAESWPDTHVVIISFDLVKKHLKPIHARTWDFLIVDEAHFLRNPDALRTKYIFGHTEKASKKNQFTPVTIPAIPRKKTALLTGTPIVNRPKEIWPWIHAVAPQKYNNFEKFALRYCGAKQTRYGWVYDGATNLRELQADLRSLCMIRRLKNDVLTELPPKTRQIICIDDESIKKAEQAATRRMFDKPEHANAKELLQTLVEDNKRTYEETVAALETLNKIAFFDMAKIRKETAIRKIPYVIDLINLAKENGKLIIFAHHEEIFKALMAQYPGEYAMVTGATPPAKRQAEADRFQNDPNCHFFFGSILAAGAGFTLTASAHVIFAEIDWVPGNMLQAEDRAHRIGQNSKVLIWHIVINRTLDAIMAKILVKKQADIDQATNYRQMEMT